MKELVAIENLTHRFQSNQLFSGLQFQIHKQEAFAIVGPSGCGKSTLLRFLAGLLSPSEGRVLFDPEFQLRLSFVFQDPALLSWKTVTENIQLPQQILQEEKKSQSEIAKWLKLVGLLDDKDKFPHELSGGMKMRASIARALSTGPNLILMDEPFSALDEMTRERLIRDFQKLQQELHFAFVLVTHSLAEALLLADRILILDSKGRKISEYQNPLNRLQSNLEYTIEYQDQLKKLRKLFHSSDQQNGKVEENKR